MDVLRGHARQEDPYASVASPVFETLFWLLLGLVSRWLGETGGALYVGALTALYLRVQLRRPGVTAASLRRPPAWTWTSLTAVALCAFVVGLMVGAVGWWPDSDSGSEALNTSPLYADFGSAVILAPVVEEVGFRGVVLSRLRARVGQRMAIAITAVIFAIVHLQLLGLGTRFLAGLLFGFAACATRSIWSAVVLHAVVNLVTIAATHVAPWVEAEVGSMFARAMGPIVCLVGLGTLLHLSLGSGRRLAGGIRTRDRADVPSHVEGS